MKKHVVATILTIMCFVLGCQTVNCVSEVSNICPVHGQTMKAKKLRILPGYLGYLSEYAAAMEKDFPNYDGPRWDHTSYVTGSRWMFAYVCAKCTQAYQEYHQQKNGNEGAAQHAAPAD